MVIITQGKRMRIIGQNYFTDEFETCVYQELQGRNLNPNDYHDITDEEAEEIEKRNQETTIQMFNK